MRLLAGAAALLAIGAGLGTYFALKGSPAPGMPRAQQTAILEQVQAEGVISGYRARGSGYDIVGGRIHLRSVRGFCAGEPVQSCGLPVFIEYQHPAERQAEAIYRIARSRLPHATINLFEITPGVTESHTPDARIMLIPKAGA